MSVLLDQELADRAHERLGSLHVGQMTAAIEHA
jgi:hypothetical protein